MNLAVSLSPGRYAVGVNIPWFLPNGMVVSEIEKRGFKNIVFHDRDSSAQLPVNPRLDPTYSDDWDQWITADYVGAPNTLNEKKLWAWAVKLPDNAPPPGTPLPLGSSSSTNSGTIVPMQGTPAPASEGTSPWLIALAIAVDVYLAKIIYERITRKKSGKKAPSSRPGARARAARPRATRLTSKKSSAAVRRRFA